MVPNGWTLRRIDQWGAVRTGRQRAPQYTKGTKRPYLRVANVFDGFIDTSDVLEMNFTDEEFAEYRLEPGEILLNEGQSLQLVGRSAIYKGEPAECCFQNTLIRFRPGPDILPEYAQLLFQHLLYSGKFAAIASQTTSIAHLGASRFASMRVVVPPLNKQRAAVDALSAWNRAVGSASALIQAKQKLKLGLMQRLLFGNQRFSGFLGEQWKTYRLSQLLTEVNRPITCSDDRLYKLVSLRRRSGGVFFREPLLGAQIKTKNLFEAQSGDFLISKMQAVHGATGLVTDEFNGSVISGSYVALAAKDNATLHMSYFNFLSQTPIMHKYVLESSHGVHIEKMTFSVNDFLKKTIRIPDCIDEQRKIAAVVETASQEILWLERQLAQLQLQRVRVMTDLVSGRTPALCDHQEV